METADYEKLAERIKKIKEETKILVQESSSFPAIFRNSQRMQACLKMIELNLGDLALEDYVDEIK